MKKELFNLQGLYKVQRKDIKKCADVAAKAFLDDPSSTYLLEKDLSHPKLYEYYLKAFNALYTDASIFAPDEAIEGFIILMPPGKTSVSARRFIESGGLALPFSVSFGILSRSLEYESNNLRIRRNVCSDETWYIFQFGVAPEKQGQGLGSKLMKPFLNWLDEQQLPCYLETHKQKNVDLYAHYGFILKATDTLPNKKHTQYGMLRP